VSPRIGPVARVARLVLLVAARASAWLLVFAAVPATVPAAPAAAARTDDLREFVARLDTLAARRDLRDSLGLVLEGLETRYAGAPAAGGWLAMAGSRLAFMARDDATEDRLLADALARARADGDTDLECRAQREMAWKAAGSGRMGEAAALARGLRESARRSAEARWAAEADLFDAALLYYTGGSMARAESLSRLALGGFRRAGEAWKTPEAFGSIALYAQLQGRESVARAHYDSAITQAERFGQRERMARYIGNLAALDRMTGHRERAARGNEKLYQLARESGPSPALIFGMHGMGTAALDRGLDREVVGWGESLLVLGAAMRNPDARARGLVLVGLGNARMGRDADAERAYRGILSMADSVQPGQRVDAALNLASALERSRRWNEALEVLAAHGREIHSRSDEHAVRLDLARNANLHALGRFEEARAAAARAWDAAGRPTAARWRVHAAASAARSALAADRTREAATWLERGRAAFDEDRAHVADPRIRAMLGRQAVLLGDAALLAALPGGAAAAFEAYEPYKARTQVEVLSGSAAREADPRPLARPAVRVAELQRDVLREGELLLSACVVPDTAVWIAVTRDTVALAPMAVDRERAELRIAEYRRLLDRPPSEHDKDIAQARRTAGTALARDLLGPVAGLLRAHGAVFVSADGPLHLLPYASLVADVTGEGLERAPVVSLVPSATALAVLRHAGRATADPGGLLAVAGPASEDSDALLPGGLREVRWLDRRFRGVTAAVAPGLDSLAGALGRHGALHFGAHARADDESPWRSGLLLAAASGEQPARWLTAQDVLAMHLPVRLAVLAACETEASRVFTGEGAIGLSTAFLGAGVPTVVATLWPVDDRATEALVRQFYERLSVGDAAGEALRRAQLAVAGDPRTSTPFYWAGFVLVGDPGSRLPLSRRASTMPVGATVAVATAVLAALLAARRRPAPPGATST